MNRPVSVVIVEDDIDYRDMLTEVLLREDDIDLLGHYTSGEAFVAALKDHRPRVVLMDIQLPGANGIATLQQVKALHPGMQFIILTVYEDAEILFDALRFGATGYLLKHTEPATIVQSILDVEAGGSPMSTAIARRVVDSFRLNMEQQRVLARLTPREQEIVGLLAQGYRYKEIADQLFLSVETVRTHIRNSYEKLQVNSRTDAVNKIKGWF